MVKLFVTLRGSRQVNTSSNSSAVSVTVRCRSLGLKAILANLRLNCSIAEANAWLTCFIKQFNQKFSKCARNSKNLHRSLTESYAELEDIFTWQEPLKVTKNLTITYDKCIYMLQPTVLNHKLVGQYISFLEYPDGTVAIMHEGREINYSIFNKLAELQPNEVFENKRLGAVLAHIQQQREALEKQNERSRAKKSMSSRKDQKAVIEQRNLNPVLDSCG